MTDVPSRPEHTDPAIVDPDPAAVPVAKPTEPAEPVAVSRVKAPGRFSAASARLRGRRTPLLVGGVGLLLGCVLGGGLVAVVAGEGRHGDDHGSSAGERDEHGRRGGHDGGKRGDRDAAPTVSPSTAASTVSPSVVPSASVTASASAGPVSPTPSAS